MGLLGTAAKVAVASSVHGRVQRRQQRRWAEQDAQAWSEAPPVAAPGQPAGGGDRLAALQKLGELHSAGVLTDVEFEAEKARILQG